MRSLLLLMSSLLGLSLLTSPLSAQDPIASALDNITTLVREGEVGYATLADGNAFVQCRRWEQGSMRCEAAGSAMQPSLANTLTPERLADLAALGWVLEPSFGLHVQTFPAHASSAEMADAIRTVLRQVYGVTPEVIEASTGWIRDQKCPPRVGASQMRAGSVNVTGSLNRVVVFECSFSGERFVARPKEFKTVDDLVKAQGPRLAGELQRLRINVKTGGYVVVSAGIGYVQCASQRGPDSLYCEAQSPESWPALASVLTPDRVERLRAAGYRPPGRLQNYSKVYGLDSNTDAQIARELLSVLFDVYGYRGAQPLGFRIR